MRFGGRHRLNSTDLILIRSIQLNCSTSYVLVRVHDVVVRDTLQRDLTYVSLTRYCFGNYAANLVYFFMEFTTVGSLGAFLVLIGKTLHSIWPDISGPAFSAIIVALLLPFCLTRNTQFLKYTSVIGNLGVLIVVIAILVRGAEISTIQPVEYYGPHFKPETFIQAFGIVGFVWSNATSMLTIEKAMEKRTEFGSAFRSATWIVFFSATAFAIVNFLYFAQDTCGIVVLNLGDGKLAMTAKIAIALDLSFSYPLCMAPAREILEKSMLTDSTPQREARRTAIRVVFMGLTWLICLIPSFGIILNIVGGVACAVLSFILPPLMLLQVRRFHVNAYQAQLEFIRTAQSAEPTAGGHDAFPNGINGIGAYVPSKRALHGHRHGEGDDADLSGGDGTSIVSPVMEHMPSAHKHQPQTDADKSKAGEHTPGAVPAHNAPAPRSRGDSDHHARKVVVFKTSSNDSHNDDEISVRTAVVSAGGTVVAGTKTKEHIRLSALVESSEKSCSNTPVSQTSGSGSFTNPHAGSASNTPAHSADPSPATSPVADDCMSGGNTPANPDSRGQQIASVSVVSHDSSDDHDNDHEDHRLKHHAPIAFDPVTGAIKMLQRLSHGASSRGSATSSSNGIGSSKDVAGAVHKSQSEPADLSKSAQAGPSSGHNTPAAGLAGRPPLAPPPKPVHTDVRIHGHTLHLPNTHSSYDVLSLGAGKTGDHTAGGKHGHGGNGAVSASTRSVVGALDDFETKSTTASAPAAVGAAGSGSQSLALPAITESASGGAEIELVPSKANSEERTPGAHGDSADQHASAQQSNGASHHHHHLGHRHATVSQYFRHPHHKNRHLKALQLLGVGSPLETVFLVTVAIFGVCVLFFTTIASIQEAIGAGSVEKEAAICTQS